MGWVGEHIGPRVALGLGGVATLTAGVLAYPALARVVGQAHAEVVSPPEG